MYNYFSQLYYTNTYILNLFVSECMQTVYNNFRDLRYLQQYERASVIGIVHSVSKFLVKK